jgi:tartrate dehydratase alpha subunit/fumarate hydratase class I-like protein
MAIAQRKYSVYKFIAPYKQSYCVEMGGTGVSGCLKTAYRDFKIGDTVISTNDTIVTGGEGKPPFVVGQLYGGDANGSQGMIPLSVLKKVASDLDAPELNKYMDNDTNMDKDGINKLIIGVLIIGGIYGVLKYSKII